MGKAHPERNTEDFAAEVFFKKNEDMPADYADMKGTRLLVRGFFLDLRR
jgi:hypothetical protein